MKKIDIDPFVSHIVRSSMQTMKGFVEQGIEPVPQIWFLATEGDGHAVLPVLGFENLFGSVEGKRKIRPMLKTVWPKIASGKPNLKLVAVLMLSDVWVEHPPIEEFERIRKQGRATPFAPKPRMEEAVFAQVSFATEEIHYEWPYVRSDDGIVFAPESNIEMNVAPTDASGSRMMGLWPL
jgi:hypothetical protein